MSNLHRGPSIDASHQALVHLAKRFQRRRFFQKSTNQKQELPVAAMFVNESGRYQQIVQRTFHRCFLPSSGSFGVAVSEEKNIFNCPIRNKNCLWRPCLLTDQDEMCKLDRGPSTDASYQVSVHLAKQFQRRRCFQKLTNQKQELPVGAMLVNESGQNQHFYRGPSTDTSYQVSVHLAQRFQRRGFLKIYTQTNTNNVNKIIRYAPSYKQLEIKTKRTSFLCGNRNGHHNMKLRT